MNRLIKVSAILAFLFSINSLLAISEELESRLLAKALLESATTPQQKTAVASYFQALAAEKREEAKKLQLLASTSRGGKVVSQNAQKREYLKKAERLEKEAKALDKLVAEGEFEVFESVAVK
jgi:hypothetical protein